MLQHSQPVVAQVELSEPGEAPEHPEANRHQLVVAEVQPLYVVQMLKANGQEGETITGSFHM